MIPTRHAVVAWGGNSNFTPQQLANSTGVVQASAGAAHSLVLSSDGTVWARVNNYTGDVGDGTLAVSTVPVQVSGLSQVTSIAAGADSALAVRTPSALRSAPRWGSACHRRPSLASHGHSRLAWPAS